MVYFHYSYSSIYKRVNATKKKKQFRQFIQFIFSINSGTEHRAGGRGVANREQRSSSRSRRGGVSENQIAVATAARLFFLTAVAIAIATRPFKFHEISVTNTSSSFVSSIHSLEMYTLHNNRIISIRTITCVRVSAAEFIVVWVMV